MIPPLDRLVRKLETSNLFLRTFAAVACVGGVLAYFWSNGDFFAGPVVFFSNRQLFIIAELSNGVGMGNQLSTWNLSIQSAVDGENFNYNPDYNQVAFFIKLPCYQSVFWAKFTSLFTATKWHRVLIQSSMARLHFLSSGPLHIRRLHLVLHRDRSDRRQSRLFGFSKSFCGFLWIGDKMTTNFLRRCCFAPDLGQHLPWLQVQVSCLPVIKGRNEKWKWLQGFTIVPMNHFLLPGNTGTAGTPATATSSPSLFSLPRTRRLLIFDEHFGHSPQPLWEQDRRTF